MISRLITISALLGQILSGMTAMTSAVCAFQSSATVRWDFDTEQAAPLHVHGEVLRDQAGPCPPEFPDFAANNTAIRLDGKGARISISDPGPNSIFDFTNGDSITLEAWVLVDGLRDGQPMYVIGKGRTGSPQFSRDNQNWALRVSGGKGLAYLSFLFATKLNSGDSHWHRWTSDTGFDPAEGWHHIAITYQFGSPETIRGWIDGQPTVGHWDLGGSSTEPPVVDDDAVWIGSSQAGSPSNSFRGLLDAVVLTRSLAEDKLMATRFRRVGGPRVTSSPPSAMAAKAEPAQEVMPDLLEIPEGQVLVTFAEALPSHTRWLNIGESWPDETARWIGHEFLLPRVPLRYDDWGIRDSWKPPVLLRMAADVRLPAGKRRLLLRTRALSRLWLDGVVVARTEPVTQQPPNGEEPMTPVAIPPLRGLRTAGYHQQEVFAEINLPEEKLCRVVLEVVVGGKNQRTETGEVCVAIETSDGTMFDVLRPATTINSRQSVPAAVEVLPLTDTAVANALQQIETSLAEFDDQNRRQAASSMDSYWQQRHAAGRSWADEHPAPEVPVILQVSADENATGNVAVLHPVDAFVAAKIRNAVEAAAAADEQEARRFHSSVLPILREQCFRCHGDKQKGGLKLNSRQAALNAGDSELPAVIPGDVQASELLARVRTSEESIRMPPVGTGLNADQIQALEDWIQSGAAWPAPPVQESEIVQPPLIGDLAFLRRVFLDTIGVLPDAEQIRMFLADSAPDKREKLIGRLLQDERCADQWMGYWLDLLAENPTLLNASLNSTGPFRWFLYDSLRDNKPLDRMVTELILLRGNPHDGGSAGFAIAAENDAPFAAKAHIVASAFQGVELQCARCHDSPYHSTTQRDLYSLAAMFERKPVTVPATSVVPAAFFEKQDRASLIRVTLKPGEPITPTWPFGEITGIADEAQIDQLLQNPDDSRERLAALITSPQNSRFARVMVNRVWKQLLGAGFVEPVHDWEGRVVSHPELLDWLAHQLVRHDYDLRHVMRLILTSQTWQRESTGRNLTASAELRFFNAPDRRRLTAEQIVDSLHQAAGLPIDVEELTFVHDGRREISNRLTLGHPHRGWMFANLANERDRPSLALPRARAVADVLEAFGWNGSRQQPGVDREMDPNVLQPGILANGTLTSGLSRLSRNSPLAQLAIDAATPEELVDTLFVRFLTRLPNKEERTEFSAVLSEGFESRLQNPESVETPEELPALPLVTWFNHLQSEANTIQVELERRARLGPPPDSRLKPEWRMVCEDLIWSLINHREFVWMP